MENLNLVIVDAIKSIVNATNATVKYDVDNHIESKGFRNKIYTKITDIHIKIVEVQ